jgi:hypothetical protein
LTFDGLQITLMLIVPAGTSTKEMNR